MSIWKQDKLKKFVKWKDSGLKSVNSYESFEWKGEFLSESDSVLYKQLALVTESFPIQILTKVALKELFVVKNNLDGKEQKYFDTIKNTYIDFLLCEADTFIPLLAIKIDEKKNEDNKFIDGLFESMQLNLVHVEAKQNYDVLELISLMESNIDMKSLIE